MDNYGFCSLICHHMPEKTFSLDGQFMPLCFRCMGIYTGFLITLIFQAISGGKRDRFPAISISLTNIFFILLMALQVAGSHFISWLENNHLRYITGILCGSSIGIFLFPMFNYSFFKKTIDEPVIGNWAKYLLLLTLLAMTFIIHFFKSFFVFYFLSFASAIGAVAIYSMVNILLSESILRWKKKKKKSRPVFASILLVSFLFSIEMLIFAHNPLKR